MSAGQKIISLDSPGEWNAALAKIEHAFAHTWESNYATQRSSGLKTFLYSFEADDAHIVCPLSERTFEGHKDIATPFGFSGFTGDSTCVGFRKHWQDFARSSGYVCGYIGLNPLFERSNFYDQGDVHRYNNIYVLDLAKSDDELFSGLSQNRKRQLRNSEDQFTKLIFDKERLSDFFITRYSEFFRNKNAAPVYAFSRETLTYLLSLENTTMVGAGNGNAVQAVTMFAHTPYVAEYLFNVCEPEGRQYAALLVWYGVQHFKSIGIPLINLGGGIHEGDGVAKFKERFGARQLPLRCLKQVYEEETFSRLCRLCNVDPADRNGYFPPFHRPSA